MNKSNLIKGGIHTDSRGTIGFVNDFDMTKVKRFYHITHKDITIIRAWQGHRIESKWFYCIAGSFEVKLIKVDDWIKPSTSLITETILLTAEESKILHIPGGYVNGFKAMTPKSTLLVFSDVNLEQSTKDDYRFDKDYWSNWE